MSHKLNAPASSTSKDARARKSSQALRDALMHLLEERQSFDEITIRDICAQAGVHYATFFRHHETKEALLDSIAQNEIAQLNELTLAIREADDYGAGFRALCTYVHENRKLFSILLNGGASAAMREEWVRQSRLVAAREEPINSWLPAELGTVCAATLIAETISWWVAQPASRFTVDQIAEILMRMLTTSIIAPD
ncbi:MAG: TetR/AcrR family transcriptional regulator [Novosphingobium sp.]|nr:TetR/AcrR family transcriptional regulator [Novosphingobium sp.]